MQGAQNRIWKVVFEEKEKLDHKVLSKNNKTFDETLFKRKFPKNNVEKQELFTSLSIKTLANE